MTSERRFFHRPWLMPALAAVNGTSRCRIAAGSGLDVAGGLSEEPGDRAHRRGEVVTALRGQRVALLDVADHVRQGCGS